ncbi:MAG: ABC transporter permease [Bacteroidales bacterium]|nr:ABC transporter permease [Bacteroidales bacterium]MDD3430516.1 ABC transporter permease [Bacteroidales bacterium]MDD4360834.1 ABC transporter permease [Bacteroidales bacterium]MDD4430194.1 ABC transporter permease [Bacteroidales bacterium]
MNPLYHVGRYSQLMYRCFSKPQRIGVFLKQMIKEIDRLGVSSLFITLIVSLFMGAVMTVQTQNNIENPILPDYTVGLVTRDTLLLEFCSMVLCLFLSGNIGSNIASQIGTMRISEQIDAMDIMGVNSANYIILPKIAAVVFYVPILVVFSMFTGMFGGYLISVFTDIITTSKFIYGIQYWFIEWYVYYSLIKAAVFAFIIASVSAYWGYYVRGGTLEVGKASTRAVVSCSVLILLADMILTQLLLL